MVGKIATGEIVEAVKQQPPGASEIGRKGGKARAESMTTERRAEIARLAAEARYKQRD
jgi:general stress protein YciG